MKTALRLLITAVLIGQFGSGCAYYYANRYQPSSTRWVARPDTRTVGNVKVTSYSPGKTDYGTWMGYVVRLPVPSEEYISGALITELTSRGMYSKEAEDSLAIHITRISVSRWPGFTSRAKAKWIITATIYGNTQELCVIESPYEFPSGPPDDHAADCSARSFSPAVQHFLSLVLGHDRVVAFITRPGNSDATPQPKGEEPK